MECRTPCSSASGDLFMAYLATPTNSVTLDDCTSVSTASLPAPHQLWITAITTHPDLPAPHTTFILVARKFRTLTRRKKKKHLLQLEFCIICRISISTSNCRRQDAYPEKRHLFLSHVATTSLSFFCLVLSHLALCFSSLCVTAPWISLGWTDSRRERSSCMYETCTLNLR